jgi:hypothetical protein
MLSYELDNTRSEPLYVQIYEKIKDDIELGDIKQGEKLPSKRTFAAQLGVSIITVENAYNQLVDEGCIRSVPKKGYYARSIEKNIAVIVERELPCKVQSDENSDMENGLFPFTVWAKLMREELSSNQRKLLTNPPFEGAYELRNAIAEHLKRFRNIKVTPKQIIIGAGTEYLYMLINLLFGNNYIFGVEEPGYSKIADIYTNYNIKCEHIPMLDDGVDIDYLKSIKTDIIHISPSHHFPTGVITSIGKRYALLEWASQSLDRYIIEDDYDSEFRLSGKPVPSLFSIDVMDKVIYMNTFSKSLSSTIRISYMILPVTLLEKFRKKLGFYSCPVSTFEQYTLARFIDEGYFEKHINRMRVHYKRCRNHLFEQMKKFDIFRNAEVSGKNSGLHCVVKFDTFYSGVSGRGVGHIFNMSKSNVYNLIKKTK